MLKRIFLAVLAVVLVLSFFTVFSTQTHAASEMKASEDCIRMIQEIEGFRAIPYWDYSQWTVGFGTACPEEHLERYKKEGIPVAEAQALFTEQLARFENAVNKFIDKHNLSLSQQQFDALVSFTYNLGSGSLNKESYTIVQAILAGATGNDMIYAFSVYCKAGGEFQPGLMRRRMAEANLYLYGIYSEDAPESYYYVHYDANGGVRDASSQGYDGNLHAVPLSRPTYEGYTFVGWYTKKDGGVKITTLDETTHGMTLYAHWEPNSNQAEAPTEPATGVQVTVKDGLVHLRSGAGMNYGITKDVYAGQVLTITGTTQANGLLWGLCSDGWICLDHTNYYDLVQIERPGSTVTLPSVPVYASVINPNGITVYTGPHTTYPQAKTLAAGKQILLEEVILFDGNVWARCEYGWIRVNSKILLHDENTLAHSFKVVTAVSGLTVRTGPGKNYEKETTLSKDASYTVYVLAYVDGAYWGRIYEGWICLDYTDFDASKVSQYQSHTYGEWYMHSASNCVTHGQLRRDCQHCEHYETAEAPLGDHGMGDWTLIQAPTCTAEGVEQRSCQYCGSSETRAVAANGHAMGDWIVIREATAEAPGEERSNCQHCDYYETRQLLYADHQFGEWYTTQDASCTAPGQQRRDCAVCGHSELREVSPLGHDYGAWYESIPATYTEQGQERRDCSRCDSYETRQTDVLPVPPVIRTYATITCDSLRVRSGPGTSYKQVSLLRKGDEVEILEIQTVGKNEWGRLENGWICLTGYTTLRQVEENGHTQHTYGEWYETIAPTTTSYGQERRDCQYCGHSETRQTDMLKVETVEKVYATITYDTLTIRSGAGTSYSKLGSLKKGAIVEILEQKTVGKNVWGRISMGWICLTDHTSVVTVTEEASESIQGKTMKVNTSSLKIRSGAGTKFDIVGYLYSGAVVEVLETVTVNGTKWARIAEGWVCADYLK